MRWSALDPGTGGSSKEFQATWQGEVRCGPRVRVVFCFPTLSLPLLVCFVFSRRAFSMSNNNRHPLSKKFAAYPRLNPLGIGRDITAADLVDQVMLAYNGGRLR